MKVFPDTNVWLSGLLGAGLCARLLDALILSQSEIIVGEPVLDEFARIARHKFCIPDEELKRTLAFMGSHTVVPWVDPLVDTFPDPDDIPVISSALAAGTQLFVTGDKALLELGTVEGMPIMSPREAYLRFRGLA